MQDLEEAINVGPHVSALDPEAMAQLQAEVKEKEALGQAKVVLWNNIDGFLEILHCPILPRFCGASYCCIFHQQVCRRVFQRQSGWTHLSPVVCFRHRNLVVCAAHAMVSSPVGSSHLIGLLINFLSFILLFQVMLHRSCHWSSIL